MVTRAKSFFSRGLRLRPTSKIPAARERQQERQKNNRFNKQNNNFAGASRFFVHFFARFARLRRENA